MKPSASSRIEVDAAALRHNLFQLQEEMAPSKLVMVVKGNAYGHGYHTTIPVAVSAGIDNFAVFSAHEAHHVHKFAPHASIQIMGHQKPEDLAWIGEAGIEVWANDPDDVADLLGRSENDPPIGVHVEIETGMYRTGLDPETAIAAAKEIADHPCTKLVGFCTHLAGAEDPANDSRVKNQLEVFHRARDALHEVGLRPACHVASSSAALRWPEVRLDAVRCGIASYGMWPTPMVQDELAARGTKLDFRPALSWHSWVMAIKDVPPGASIGYGSSFCTTESTRIAVVPVGYGDGLARVLSSGGTLLIRGRRCPIVGQINMNMVLALVQDESIRPGDRVVLIGEQGTERIGVRSFSEWNDSVNYELMTRLSWEIPRVAAEADPDV